MALVGDPAERALQDHLADLISLDGAEADCRHVLAVREAEAIRLRSVRYLGASVWRPVGFAWAKSATVAEARDGERDRDGPRSRGRDVRAADVVGKLFAEIQAEDAGGAT